MSSSANSQSQPSRQPPALSQDLIRILQSTSPRSESDVNRLCQAFSSLQYFEDLAKHDPSLIYQVCQCAKLRIAKREEHLFDIYKLAEKFYIVISGSVELFHRNTISEADQASPIMQSDSNNGHNNNNNKNNSPIANQREQNKDQIPNSDNNNNNFSTINSNIGESGLAPNGMRCIQVKQAGEGIGSVDLLYERNHSQTAICQSESVLLLSITANQSLGYLRDIAHHSSHCVHLRGDVLYHENAPADRVYIVINGTYTMQKSFDRKDAHISPVRKMLEEPQRPLKCPLYNGQTRVQQQMKLKIMTSNEIFGEEEILNGHSTRTQSVTCTSLRGECYAVTRTIFKQKIIDVTSMRDSFNANITAKNITASHAHRRIAQSTQNYINYFFQEPPLNHLAIPQQQQSPNKSLNITASSSPTRKQSILLQSMISSRQSDSPRKPSTTTAVLNNQINNVPLIQTSAFQESPGSYQNAQLPMDNTNESPFLTGIGTQSGLISSNSKGKQNKLLKRPLSQIINELPPTEQSEVLNVPQAVPSNTLVLNTSQQQSSKPQQPLSILQQLQPPPHKEFISPRSSSLEYPPDPMSRGTKLQVGERNILRTRFMRDERIKQAEELYLMKSDMSLYELDPEEKQRVIRKRQKNTYLNYQQHKSVDQKTMQDYLFQLFPKTSPRTSTALTATVAAASATGTQFSASGTPREFGLAQSASQEQGHSQTFGIQNSNNPFTSPSVIVRAGTARARSSKSSSHYQTQSDSSVIAAANLARRLSPKKAKLNAQPRMLPQITMQYNHDMQYQQQQQQQQQSIFNSQYLNSPIQGGPSLSPESQGQIPFDRYSSMLEESVIISSRAENFGDKTNRVSRTASIQSNITATDRTSSTAAFILSTPSQSFTRTSPPMRRKQILQLKQSLSQSKRKQGGVADLIVTKQIRQLPINSIIGALQSEQKQQQLFSK